MASRHFFKSQCSWAVEMVLFQHYTYDLSDSRIIIFYRVPILVTELRFSSEHESSFVNVYQCWYLAVKFMSVSVLAAEQVMVSHHRQRVSAGS